MYKRQRRNDCVAPKPPSLINQRVDPSETEVLEQRNHSSVLTQHQHKQGIDQGILLSVTMQLEPQETGLEEDSVIEDDKFISLLESLL